MANKEELRAVVADNLNAIVVQVNRALAGDGLADLETELTRLGRGAKIPHWYPKLLEDQTLPNRDGKTIGSVIEMVLVAVLEKHFLKDSLAAPMRINPARGVDLPDLDLGVKSPSTNYCTSEPYYSAYERLLGNEHDAIILLTNYQTRKGTEALAIIKQRYMRGSQIADRNLCAVARSQREFLYDQNPHRTSRFFQFLAYVNQSDWRAKRLVRCLSVINDEVLLLKSIEKAIAEYDKEQKLECAQFSGHTSVSL